MRKLLLKACSPLDGVRRFVLCGRHDDLCLLRESEVGRVEGEGIDICPALLSTALCLT